jgi:hypothetical protein
MILYAMVVGYKVVCIFPLPTPCETQGWKAQQACLM